MWLPFSSLWVCVIHACPTSSCTFPREQTLKQRASLACVLNPSPEFSLPPAPGVPSQSYADASRSPPARSMLLKSLTQKSSPLEVSAAVSIFGLRNISSCKLTAVGSSARSVQLQACWFKRALRSAPSLSAEIPERLEATWQSCAAVVQWALAVVCSHVWFGYSYSECAAA